MDPILRGLVARGCLRLADPVILTVARKCQASSEMVLRLIHPAAHADFDMILIQMTARREWSIAVGLTCFFQKTSGRSEAKTTLFAAQKKGVTFEGHPYPFP